MNPLRKKAPAQAVSCLLPSRPSAVAERRPPPSFRPRTLSALGTAVVLTFVSSFAAPSRAEAAGLLIADGGLGGRLKIEEHDVEVTLNNGIAVTRVTQVFENLEDRIVEALYTFPVPKKASVSNFSMWIGGKEMVGEVVEKERAREIYNSYKRVRRDPGLLEQVDYKTFEMRIFPIAARAKQKVEITYYQELDHDHDSVTYVYPLATVSKGGIDSKVEGAFRIRLDIHSAIPIEKVESPSHRDDVVTAAFAKHYSQVSLESAEGDLGADFVLTYRLSRPKTGVDLIASKRKSEDGTFCLLLTAGEDLEKHDAGMDFVFVLDVSGSMANSGKLELSTQSIAAFIDSLSEKDRFELITFNIQPQQLFGRLENMSTEGTRRAKDFLDSQQARGGTVLNPAIQAAYKYADADRQLNVVVLSDGMTDQREASQLTSLIHGRPANSRVFCIGVGNEVNRPLLESVAQRAGGLAAFISLGDDFERQARAFRRKLTRPAAAGVKIDFGGSLVYDVEPQILPDLYHGSPIRVYGRYREGSSVTISIEADVAGRTLKTRADVEFPAVDLDNPEIERMWAAHRIDGLLKEADSRGSRAAAIPEVIALGEEFSIVTEYTSFLVLENDAEYQRWKIERRNRDRIARDREAGVRLAKRLEELRDRAVAGIGPEAVKEVAQNAVALETARAPAATQPASSPPRHAPREVRAEPSPHPAPPPSRPSRGFDFRGGGGPVGPVFVALAAWAARRKKRRRDRGAEAIRGLAA